MPLHTPSPQTVINHRLVQHVRYITILSYYDKCFLTPVRLTPLAYDYYNII
ncbi:hypothetical protein E2C01_099861 [Portunus trituberculatus]|uniref:Uncharacterized protein n=1 Tax=Portunus trituberculatus TaxID=210409 RepID=A0A5B7KC06_PORTR|nr:hypothetical protein [Portunus trituberculatus]